VQSLGSLRENAVGISRLAAAEALATPAVLSVFSALLFALPPQAHEIYRDIAQELTFGSHNISYYVEPTLSLLAVIGVCATLFLICEHRLLQLTSETLNRLSLVICINISTFPLLGMAAGLWLARPSAASLSSVEEAIKSGYIQYLHTQEGVEIDRAKRQAGSFAHLLMQFDGLLLWASIAALLLAIGAWFLLLTHASASVSRVSKQILTKSTSLGVLVVATIFVSTLVAVLPTGLLKHVSWIGFLGVFLIFVSLWLECFRNLREMTEWPLLGTVICCAILFSAFDLNNNHGVRELAITDARSPRIRTAAPKIDQEFKRWLQSRVDTQAYATKRYPIYIVAAQGGGIYAAYHTARFLAHLQDQCPAFAHHMFAISSVSGGSVGAAVFASLMRQVETAFPNRSASSCKERDLPGGVLLSATTEILSNDFLTPPQGRMLFPDFLQQLLFFPLPYVDRARALEFGLEDAWTTTITMNEMKSLRGPNVSKVNPISGLYIDHWRPDKASLVPALLLNTTESLSGRRRVIAPFEFDGVDVRLFPVWNNGSAYYRLPLSSAAFLSARFPWITPAGWFRDENGFKVSIVDGGYFENSGVVTALDIIDGIETALEADAELQVFRDKIEIDLIVLASHDFEAGSFYGLSEVLDPIRTMLSSWRARTVIEVKKARRLLGARKGDGVEVTKVPKHVMLTSLNGLGYPLPLGWRLSILTRFLIDGQLGNEHECTLGTLEEIMRSEDPTPDCIDKAVLQQLRQPLQKE